MTPSSRGPRPLAIVLPCPYCGAPPEIQPWHGGPRTKRLVSCSNVEGCAMQPMITGDTEAEALAAWNQRPGDAA